MPLQPGVGHIPGPELTTRSDASEIIQRTKKYILFDFPLTVKAALHKCVIRTGQP